VPKIMEIGSGVFEEVSRRYEPSNVVTAFLAYPEY